MKFAKKEKSGIELEIDKLEEKLQSTEIGTEEYEKILTALERLNKLKENKFKGIDPNTMLLVGGNILGIIIILGYEKTGVIASKAMGFIGKGRV